VSEPFASPIDPQSLDPQALLEQLQVWGRELGFSQIGVADIDLSAAEGRWRAWLDNGFHGAMDYMAAHGLKRSRPAELVPGTVRVVTARLDYLPRATGDGWQALEWQRLAEPERAAVSIYARGRDYHKVSRARLRQLVDRLADAVGPFGHRVFTDSAPVLEVELATRSGLGWRGKHTLALDRNAGSMFFLGEIYVDLPLPPTPPVDAHCGTCQACIDVCPTAAIVAPYELDARRCISYLTIELKEAIPIEFRAAIGNRIYGCDDCQLVCPWNKYAQASPLADFDARPDIDGPPLLVLWAWNEAAFLHATEGSAIRRIGFERWQRNLAVALGNALREAEDSARRDAIVEALQARRADAGVLVQEHIDWALQQARPGARLAVSAAATVQPARPAR
jgi:epoxyqueuosine reductase